MCLSGEPGEASSVVAGPGGHGQDVEGTGARIYPLAVRSDGGSDHVVSGELSGGPDDGESETTTTTEDV